MAARAETGAAQLMARRVPKRRGAAGGGGRAPGWGCDRDALGLGTRSALGYKGVHVLGAVTAQVPVLGGCPGSCGAGGTGVPERSMGWSPPSEPSTQARAPQALT